MSGGLGGSGEAGVSSDPSMDDILASIRRILDEEPAAAAASPGPAVAASAEMQAPGADAPGALAEGELVLDETMLASSAPLASGVAASGRSAAAVAREQPAHEQRDLAMASDDPGFASGPGIAAGAAGPLIGARAADSAVNAMSQLVRVVASDRSSQIHAGGPTIEEVVRQELRPLLQAWLDQHLPPLVERVVRAEIERVAGRVGG